MKKGTLVFIAFFCFLACSRGGCEQAGRAAELSVSFADAKWDGLTIPEIGRCRDCGGEGFSPALLVREIPPGADSIIIEFHDRTLGIFHGAVRFAISRGPEFVVPSFREQTFDLPRGAEMESAHRAPLGRRGAYMAPCGCGDGNLYEAVLLAVGTAESGKKLILGKGKIILGKF